MDDKSNKSLKTFYRKQILRKVKQIDIHQKAENNRLIFENFVKHYKQYEFSIYFSFVNFKSEVDTSPIINFLLKENKTVCIPKIIENRIKIVPVQISDLNQLTYTNIYGIKEPKNLIAFNKPIECTITPGVVFDEHKNRIGYGKGYYDRFFEKNPKTYKIALCYESQIIKEQIPTSSNDIQVDLIITEKRIF